MSQPIGASGNDLALLFELEGTSCHLSQRPPQWVGYSGSEAEPVFSVMTNLLNVEGTYFSGTCTALNYRNFSSLFENVNRVNQLSGRKAVQLYVMTDTVQPVLSVLRSLQQLHPGLRLDGCVHVPFGYTKTSQLDWLQRNFAPLQGLQRRRIVTIDSSDAVCRAIFQNGFSAWRIGQSQASDTRGFRSTVELVNSALQIPALEEDALALFDR